MCGQDLRTGHDYRATSSPGSSRFPISRRFFPNAAILENEKTLGTRSDYHVSRNYK